MFRFTLDRRGLTLGNETRTCKTTSRVCGEEDKNNLYQKKGQAPQMWGRLKQVAIEGNN